MEKRLLVTEMNYLISGRMYTSYAEEIVTVTDLNDVEKLRLRAIAKRFDNILDQVSDFLTKANASPTEVIQATIEIEKNACTLSRFEFYKVK